MAPEQLAAFVVSIFFTALGSYGLLGLALSLWERRAERRKKGEAYKTRPGLFTREEKALLAALEDAAGDGYRVFAKVRLADLVEAAGGPARRGGLSSRRIDFVVCGKEDFSVVCVVELENKTRANAAFIERVLRDAGLPLLRVPSASRYNARELRAKLEGKLPALGRSCPKCAAAMLLRQETAGPDAGRKFWRCPKYPVCWGELEAAPAGEAEVTSPVAVRSWTLRSPASPAPRS